jgi:Tol biopolymer transport system component
MTTTARFARIPGTRLLALVLLIMLALAATAAPGWARAAKTRRVSRSSAGAGGNNYSIQPSISGNGRFVAFTSRATNLIDSKTSGIGDVFVRDRKTGAITLVSATSSGVGGNGFSSGPSISASGRFVAFGSDSSNLVGGDTNIATDVFVRDRETGTTTRVSVSSAGAQGEQVANSVNPSISADGRFVAFDSWASNLVGDDTNGTADIFVRDRMSGTTTRVSVSSAGVGGDDFSFDPSISADGRFVAFDSYASNLVGGDTNGTADIFVRDRMSGTTTRVSVSPAGTQGNGDSVFPSISADGRFVAFYSAASNLVGGDTNGFGDIFVRDRGNHTTTRVSVSSAGVEENNNAGDLSISADGRFVGFSSFASNLVGGDTNGFGDVFVRDRRNHTTTRVSVSSAGAEGNHDSYGPSISAAGRFVAFNSFASNLVGGDTNGTWDVFVRGPLH